MVGQSSFWDDIHFQLPSAKRKRPIEVNKSALPQARIRNFSMLLGKECDEKGNHLYMLYSYPRAYAPACEQYASPMPPALQQLGESIVDILTPVFAEHGVQHNGFNHVQVRCAYEVFNPSVGPYSDNGLIAEGVTKGTQKQASNSPVVIYMFGDCSMLLDFHPQYGSRPGVTIPFGDGWLFVLMPGDDRTCKHSLRMAYDELHAHRYRVSMVFRELVHPAWFDARTRKMVDKEL